MAIKSINMEKYLRNFQCKIAVAIIVNPQSPIKDNIRLFC